VGAGHAEIEAMVASWRESVAHLFAGREDVLDELEAHLWEEIDRRTASS
jgi:hypothetical protein